MKQTLKRILPDKLIKIGRNLVSKELKNRVVCPLCNSEFNAFTPFGIIQRENARCPQCGSLERHRLLWLYLHKKKIVNILPNISILHFAPEKALYDYFSKNNSIQYIPCDIMPDKYNYNGHATVVKVDIINIPYDDNFFDIILCNHVLEHIQDDYKAMSELFRVMKKGGWGIFQVPMSHNNNTYEDFSITSPQEREKAFGQLDHVRVYGKDYKKRLESAGFNVVEDNYVKSFSKRELFKYGLIDSEVIYLCTK